MDQKPRTQPAHIGSVSIPCTLSDIANIELMFQIWSDPRFSPSTKTKTKTKKPVLLIVFNTASQDLIAKVHGLYASFPKLPQYFSKLAVTSADLQGDRDIYHRDLRRKMGKYGNKAGPNFLFQKTLNTASEYGGFSLQIELDCFPSSSGWLDRCNRLIGRNVGTWVIGSMYAGSFGLNIDVLNHLNGNGLYDVGNPNFIKFLNEIWIPRTIQLADVAPYLAYDCWWAYELNSADSCHGNYSWQLVQTYDSFFKNEPFVVNLLPVESTAFRFFEMYKLFDTLGKTPIFFHSSSTRPLVEKTLKISNTTLLDVLEREAIEQARVENPTGALPNQRYDMLDSNANPGTRLGRILKTFYQKLVR